MKKLLRVLAIAVMGIGLSTGAVSAATTVDTTGPDSEVNISSNEELTYETENNNEVALANDNDQAAESGNATTSNNTTGGNATSGYASNGNSLVASVSLTNRAASVANTTSNGDNYDVTVENTGPNSDVTVTKNREVTVTQTNNNAIAIENRNTQTATTGTASVNNNTTGGSATSGNASNTSSSSITVNITN